MSIDLEISQYLKLSLDYYKIDGCGSVEGSLTVWSRVWDEVWRSRDSIRFAGRSCSRDFWVPQIVMESTRWLDRCTESKISSWLSETFRGVIAPSGSVSVRIVDEIIAALGSGVDDSTRANAYAAARKVLGIPLDEIA